MIGFREVTDIYVKAIYTTPNGTLTYHKINTNTFIQGNNETRKIFISFVVNWGICLYSLTTHVMHYFSSNTLIMGEDIRHIITPSSI